MKKPLAFALMCLSLLPLVLPSCAVNPTCPGNLMPIVEIQINNTASNHDDYGSTAGYTTCQARVTNFAKYGGGQNFPGGVAVEVRNPAAASNLQFSTAGGGAGGSASIFATLPATGGWLTFYVKGTATNSLDKSASVEMATAGATCNEVVLGRKALMIPSGTPPIPAAPARPRVEIEVGTIATLDDYVAWSPVSSRIRWSGGSAGSTVNVTLQNMSGTDRLRFADSSLAGGATATNTTLPLTLNGDGSWVTFYVAGKWSDPLQGPVGSVNDKDAVLEVIDASTSLLLSREGLMVRIRKNANALSAPERDRYLNALNKINSAPFADYIDFIKTHSRDTAGFTVVSHRQAHSGSAFLPWHRAFILHIERLLQAADPSVALPYWKFDAPAPNVLSPDFMGSNSAGNLATLAAGNPIVNWTLAGEGVPTGIQRKTPYNSSTGNPTVASEASTLALGGAGFTYAGFKTMEGSAHNPAHSTSGFTNASGQPLPGASWIGGSPASAPRDPLFYFLHCNVDRLWAKWQWLRNRYTVTAVNAYDLQGSHSAPGPGVLGPAFTQNSSGQITANRTLGQYAGDSMWPWDNVTGGSATAGRPSIAILTPFPITVGGLLPFARPTVAGLIDYLMITSTSPNPGIGFGYDDFFPY